MCNTEIKTTIELIRFINEQANIVYGGENTSFNHGAYIKHCSDAFASYFKLYLKDRFLFSTLSAWNRKKTDGVFFANREKRYDYNIDSEGTFKPIIEGFSDDADSLLNDIRQKRSISITKYLLKESYGFDMIFEGNKSYDTPIRCDNDNAKIIFLPLNGLIFNGDISIFQITNKVFIESFADKLRIIKDPESEYTIEKTSRLLWYYKKMQVEYCNEFDGKDFMVHFIRPSFIDFDHNMLLSLATNLQLDEEELSSINLILFKIVALMATERVKEVETLKRKASFSLTTHSLKTQLGTTVIKLKNNFKDKLNALSLTELTGAFNELDNEIEELYDLTSLLSLIDKIIDREIFCKAGIESGLLSNDRILFNLEQLKTFTNEYNARQKGFPDIEIECANKQFQIDFPVYGKFLSFKLIKLFINTLFENLIKYGKRESNKIKLVIVYSDKNIEFTNVTIDKLSPIDESKLKGNLKLFKELIEETKSGDFLIRPDGNVFKIELKHK